MAALSFVQPKKRKGFEKAKKREEQPPTSSQLLGRDRSAEGGRRKYGKLRPVNSKGEKGRKP